MRSQLLAGLLVSIAGPPAASRVTTLSEWQWQGRVDSGKGEGGGRSQLPAGLLLDRKLGSQPAAAAHELKLADNCHTLLPTCMHLHVCAFLPTVCPPAGQQQGEAEARQETVTATLEEKKKALEGAKKELAKSQQDKRHIESQVGV